VAIGMSHNVVYAFIGTGDHGSWALFLLSTGDHGHAATWEQADGRWQKHRLKENRRRCINGVFLFRYRIQSMHDIEANN